MAEKRTVEWRLDKLLAVCTGISRSEAQSIIKKGEVFYEGQAITKPEKKLPLGCTVMLSGQQVLLSEFVYIMLHKPAGYLSASRDKNAPTVLDLVPKNLYRKTLFVSGRLDKDTEGLLLITDDGAFSHRILSPKNKVPKQYYARLSHPVGSSAVEAFAAGMQFDDGSVATPAKLQLLEDGNAALVTIYEGFYHQVKRMFIKCSSEVVYLKRLKIGELKLDETLQKGECRMLTIEELAQIESKQ